MLITCLVLTANFPIKNYLGHAWSKWSEQGCRFCGLFHSRRSYESCMITFCFCFLISKFSFFLSSWALMWCTGIFCFYGISCTLCIIYLSVEWNEWEDDWKKTSIRCCCSAERRKKGLASGEFTFFNISKIVYMFEMLILLSWK